MATPSPFLPAPAPQERLAPGRRVSPAVAAVRLVTGFAGFGAGSVNLAISAGMFTTGAQPPAAGHLLWGAVAGFWGVALLAGAVVFLARDLPAGGPLAQRVLAGAAAVHLAAVAVPAAGVPGSGLTQLSALLLTLMIIASFGWLRRAEIRQPPARRSPAPAQSAAGQGNGGVRPGRLLLAAFAGAVLVAGITTPGLAASTAGQSAVPHGEHGRVAPGGHHQR